MKKKKAKKRSGKKRLLLAVLIICIAAVVVLRLRSSHTEKQTGYEYIVKMEQMDVSDVKNRIQTSKKEEKRRLLAEGKLSVWDQFDDYALLGDSRAVGFEYFGCLDENRVLAEGGAVIRDIKDVFWDDLMALSPHTVFLCFGLNDVSIGIWDTTEEYTAEFESILQEIHESLPDVTIVISSTLIARDPAFSKSEKWYNIPEFNEAVKEMCEKTGDIFVDNSDLCEDYAELWDSDGIHVAKEFYPYWGANLIAEVEDNA